MIDFKYQNLISKLNTLNKQQIINGLVAPILRDFYGWDRDNIEEVDCLTSTDSQFDFILNKSSKNSIAVAVLLDITALNNCLGIIDNMENHISRFYLIIQKENTKLYDSKYKKFKDDIDFYNPDTLDCLKKENLNKLSYFFDSSLIKNYLDALNSKKNLNNFLLFNSLEIDPTSLDQFLDNNNLICLSNLSSVLGSDYIRLEKFEQEKLGIEYYQGTKPVEFVLTGNFEIFFRIDFKELNYKLWHDAFMYMLDFIKNVYKIDYLKSNIRIKGQRLVDDKNQYIDETYKNNQNYHKLNCLLDVLDYLKIEKSLDLNIYIKFERLPQK